MLWGLCKAAAVQGGTIMKQGARKLAVLASAILGTVAVASSSAGDQRDVPSIVTGSLQGDQSQLQGMCSPVPQVHGKPRIRCDFIQVAIESPKNSEIEKEIAERETMFRKGSPAEIWAICKEPMVDLEKNIGGAELRALYVKACAAKDLALLLKGLADFDRQITGRTCNVSQHSWSDELDQVDWRRPERTNRPSSGL